MTAQRLPLLCSLAFPQPLSNQMKRTQAIADLIKALDQRKDEAIERTFRGVAKHFRDVFAELVPGGSASLRIIKEGPVCRR